MSLAQSLVASLATNQPEVDDKTLVIDHYTRSIIIPSGIKSLGVENDDAVLRLNFRMPRYLGTVDLHKFNIYINYINAQGKDDVYDVDDATVVGDDVTFSWLVGPTATAYIGTTSFNVRMVIVDSDAVIKQEYNTAIAKLQVLQGLKCNKRAVSKYSDLLAQWERKLFGVTDTEEAKLVAASETQQQRIVDKGNAVLATIPGEYSDTVALANEGIRTKADAIICSAQGESITISDSSDDNLRGLKIFGKTTQGADPTPDNPQELVSIENPTVSIRGTNMFDITAFVNNAKNNGIQTAIKKVDDTIQVMVTSYLEQYTSYDFGFEPNTQYSIMFDAFWDNATHETAQCSVLFYYSDGTTSTIDLPYISGSKTYFKTSAGGKTITGIAIGTWRYAGLCILKNINLVKGAYTSNTMPTYKKCEPQSIVIAHTIHGLPVTSGGNYTDSNGQQWICDEIDFERGVYVQRVYVDVIDGTTTKVSRNGSGENTYLYYSSVPYVNKRVAGYCTHFKHVAAYPDMQDEAGMFNTSLAAAIYFNAYGIVSGDNATLTSPNEFNAWFAQQYAAGTPVKVYYALENPIETPLTADEIAAFKVIKSNYPNTTVLNDAGAGMLVRYNADTETWIKNLIDEKIAAAVAKL